jgi:hypothetical protein
MADSSEMGAAQGITIGRAAWEDDHWRFLSPSRSVSCFVAGDDGEALSPSATYRIDAGPQEIALEVNGSSVCELRLRVRGLDSDELTVLKSVLASAAGGSGYGEMRVRMPAMAQRDGSEAVLFLEFDRAGEFHLLFPPIGTKNPSRPEPILIEVGEGKRPCLGMEWR